jgi:hypothetical protein
MSHPDPFARFITKPTPRSTTTFTSNVQSVDLTGWKRKLSPILLLRLDQLYEGTIGVIVSYDGEQEPLDKPKDSTWQHLSGTIWSVMLQKNQLSDLTNLVDIVTL